MTISPPSDIVLEVARAADPAKLAAATERLRDIAAARGRDTGAFETLVAQAAPGGNAAPAPVPPARFDADRARVRLANLETLGAPPARPIGAGADLPAPRAAPAHETPAVRFEAQFLRTVVETMLPDTQSLYGEGTAGSIWKGFLAEEIGAELARAGGVGIADALAQTHPELARVNAAKAALWPEHANRVAAAPESGAGYFSGFFRG